MKEKDFDWFEKLLIVTGTNLADIKGEVQEVMKEYGYESEYEGRPKKIVAYKVASKLIRDSALKAGTIGGVSGAFATIPGLGTISSIILATTADLAILLRIQVELCYSIAVAYDVSLNEEELRAITLAIMGFSGSTQCVKGITAGVTRKLVDELAENYLKIGIAKATEGVAEALIPRLMRNVFKFLPLVGVPLGASINIVSTMKLGNQARKYFSTWHDPVELDVCVGE
uniref:Magnetosome protein Mad31 n=1 Tax=uncultured Nitrospirota bacterium TaxID=170969 RepID=A0A142BU49_9BACT|nr:magnetosome protein Mad31 [uncultured Nitrospirota bacterium]